MCWFGREDQTCSTRNRIADTVFIQVVLFYALVWKAIGWIESIFPRSSSFRVIQLRVKTDRSLVLFYRISCHPHSFNDISGTVERITTAIPSFGSSRRRLSDDIYVR